MCEKDTSPNTVSTLRRVRSVVCRGFFEEVESADNPARLSPSDTARSRLKPLSFVDTQTLFEINGKTKTKMT